LKVKLRELEAITELERTYISKNRLSVQPPLHNNPGNFALLIPNNNPNLNLPKLEYFFNPKSHISIRISTFYVRVSILFFQCSAHSIIRPQNAAYDISTTACIEQESHVANFKPFQLEVNYIMSSEEVDTFDIQEEVVSTHHPIFKLRYRQGSQASIESASSVGSERLPVIKVLGTGGTIAAKGSTAFQTAGYHVDLTIEDLVSSIPDLSHTCELEFEQVFNLDSKEITTKELLALRNKVQEDLHHFDGIVITHGTDTCEETAFFLDSTVDTLGKPVVICGSMRPSTSVSADGPSNLYQACVVASDKQSRGRGILVTLNDKIGSGYYISKTDANSLDTFKSLGHGYLGNFVNGEVHYYFPAQRPTGLKYFQLPSNFGGPFPKVMVFYAHQGFDHEIIRLAVETMDIKGVVMATMGAGSLRDETNKMLGELSAKFNVPVVYSKRSVDGMVPKGSMPKTNNAYLIAGGYLNPQKARLLLQLCLYERLDVKKIRKVFSASYGG